MNRNSPLQKNILTQLSKHPMTVRQIADSLYHDENVIRTALELLCDKGSVRRNGMSTDRWPKQLFEVAA